MDTCHLTLNQIQAYEAAAMDNINLLPYSEGLLEIQDNVQTVQTLIQFLNTMIYNYGKRNCDNAEFYYYGKMGCEADIRELVILNK